MKYAVMSQMHCTQPTMYKFFCLKIDIKNKADSYMPCEAMAHSTKYTEMIGKIGSTMHGPLNTNSNNYLPKTSKALADQ